MSFSAVIAKPEYDNVIKQNPAGSAYPWSASTGVLDANFADTIGTTDSIQIFTQGYTFAWKPDTVNVIDDADTMTLLENVNPNAAAQVWNNKVTYVGTTLSTSDEFVVDGNQLKHSVHMVAPPRLPSGLSGTPKYLAIGGDIGTTAQDWADIDLIADGESHLTDFVTSDDLKFCLKDTGAEVYRIPHITITDNEGNETSGQYKLVFNSNDSVTMYMLCPWDWLQQAQYPIIIDPTVIVSNAYDTSGNGGRKIVRLSNGYIGTVMLNGGNVYLYQSKDNGQTWSQLWSVGTAQSGLGAALTTDGTNYYVLFGSYNSSGSTYNIQHALIDSTGAGHLTNVDTPLNSLSGMSITTDGTGAIQASWSCKNSTYANSFNIRYSKGTVSGTTVTWASPTQVTTANTSASQHQHPCIVVTSNNTPIIFDDYTNGNYYIEAWVWSGTSWGSGVIVYSGSTYTQSNPCAAIDSNGVIHVVWQGGSASSSVYQIGYSKSTDGGSTWSTVTWLTTDTAYGTTNPTLTIDPTSNNLYVFGQKSVSGYFNIFEIKYTSSSASWGSPAQITTDTTGNAQNPQTLWSEFNMNSSDAVRMIYSDTQAGTVEYYTITLDSPPNAPILTTQSNFDATTAKTFYWQFSDPDPGDSQSAYQLQIVDTSNSSTVLDTGKVASTMSSYTLAANTLSQNKNYQWRVLTYDSQGQQGSFSAYSTFSTAAAPNITITSPTSGATVTTSSITLQWSYSDPANNAQQSFDVQVLDSTDATVLSDSGTVTSTGNQYTAQYVLANNTNYHAKVTVTNSKGVSASSDIPFSTAFTPPATPTLTAIGDSDNARLTIAITNPSGTPTVASNSLYRKVSGTTTWSLIASNLPVNGSYEDYTVASGQAYDYKVTAYANNGTQTDSALLTTQVIFTGDWVYNPTSGQQFQFLYNRKAYAMAISEERKEVQTFGSKPMIRRGPLNARTGTLDALMVKIGTGQTPITQLQAFEADMVTHPAYYLKTAAGEVFKVDLHNVKRSMPAENLNSQAIGVSVDWTEIA